MARPAQAVYMRDFIGSRYAGREILNRQAVRGAVVIYREVFQRGHGVIYRDTLVFIGAHIYFFSIARTKNSRVPLQVF
ncbi:hypothetical protein D9M69_666830 [compost metagenome]